MKSTTKLPAVPESEQQLIGALLIDPTLVPDISKKVDPGAMWNPLNRQAFAELLAMHREGKPIDPVLLKARLEKRPAFSEVGAAACYLAQAGMAVSTTAHVDAHANELVEAWCKRVAFEVADTAREHALNGRPSAEVIADLAAGVEDLLRLQQGEVERICFAELKRQNPVLSEPVVHGLFRAGETCNVIASSKMGKSWLVYSLALSIITGKPWLETFEAVRGRVLLVDNELHAQTLANRIPTVAEALELFPSDYENDLDVWPLRGRLRSIQQLAIELMRIERDAYRVIVIDAKYRAIAQGTSENDNAAETHFYNQVDAIAQKTNAAIVLVHHASKGNQSEKSVTDVGSGAGAQARATDCHVVLRPHEESGVVVMDAAVRSFPPIEPIALRWNFPLWHPTDAVDTARLKGKQSKRDEQQAEKDREGIELIARKLEAGPMTPRTIRGETGISKERTQRLLDMMYANGDVTRTETIVRGNHTHEYQLSETLY